MTGGARPARGRRDGDAVPARTASRAGERQRRPGDRLVRGRPGRGLGPAARTQRCTPRSASPRLVRRVRGRDADGRRGARAGVTVRAGTPPRWLPARWSGSARASRASPLTSRPSTRPSIARRSTRRTRWRWCSSRGPTTAAGCSRAPRRSEERRQQRLTCAAPACWWRTKRSSGRSRARLATSSSSGTTARTRRPPWSTSATWQNAAGLRRRLSGGCASVARTSSSDRSYSASSRISCTITGASPVRRGGRRCAVPVPRKCALAHG